MLYDKCRDYVVINILFKLSITSTIDTYFLVFAFVDVNFAFSKN